MKTKNTVFWIALGIVLLVVVWYSVRSYQPKPKEAVPKEGQVYTTLPKSHCGMTVVSPLENTKISLPYSITAIVDNTGSKELGCSWGVFEAQAGSVEIVKPNGEVASTTPVKTVNPNWMTSDPVAYGTTIEKIEGLAGPVTLRFIEDNTQGIDNPDRIEMSVIIQ